MIPTRVFALLALMSSTPILATPLSQEDRTHLVGKTIESCLSGQAREPSNLKLTIGKLQDFCRCYSEAVVSSMQVEDFVKNQDTASPEMTKASGEAFNTCVAKTFKP